MEIENLRANSAGQSLIDHLSGVMLLSYAAAKYLGANDELAKYAAVAGYLHDIGKCSDYFQHGLKHEFDGNFPRHNEISWVYTSYRIKDRGVDYKKIIPQAVYWHHGTLLYPDEIKNRTSDQIQNECGDTWDDLMRRMDALIKYAPTDVVDINSFLETVSADSNAPIPSLFEQDRGCNNSKRMLVRSCLIWADRKISSITPKELKVALHTKDVDQFLPHVQSQSWNITCPDHFDEVRFQKQQEIVDQCGRTTVVKAPAGFGKTAIGLLWGLKQPGPVYWVCPRNTVAEGVYLNILKDLKHFGLDVSVELYLTGEQKKHTHGQDPFSSDIVVTNVDSLVAPMVNHRLSDLYQINMANVVMDEYHELISDEALFGAFLTFMRNRHELCSNVQTLLMTATPSVIHHLWNSKSKPVVILPNEEEHYTPQHNKPYHVSIEAKFSRPQQSGLVMYSSIKNVQKQFAQGFDEIIHSKYSDQDRNKKLENILNAFGPVGLKNLKVIAAPILQAALDISFTSLHKTIESPESDLQTIGRVNRWGNEEEANICFLDLTSDKGEGAAIRTRFDTGLHQQWNAYLKSNIQSSMTLTDWYKLYNNFNKDEEKAIIDWLKKQENKSIEELRKFYPKQRKTSNDDKIRSGSTLRSSGVRPFLVVKNYEGEWCDFTFQLDGYELKSIQADPDNQVKWNHRSSLIKAWKKLNKLDTFDFSELLNKYNKTSKAKARKIPTQLLDNWGRMQVTPLPVFTYKYCPNLGLRKNI